MNRKQQPAGIILLVVLSSLTFFSVLLAAYLVFSNQSRQASFAISARNIHRPNVKGIIDDALMTFIRGTNLQTNPFYGEDLLSDYYGRSDAMRLQVRASTTPTAANGFIRLSLENEPIPTGTPPLPTLPTLSTNIVDDLYTGRIITFTSGNFAVQSFRILHSISTSAGNHEVIIETKPELGSTVPIASDKIWMNGVPRSSPGLGFDGTAITQTVSTAGYTQPNPALSQPGFTGSPPPTVGFNLPVALQPNHLGLVNKSTLVQNGSDFDEGYDAPDFYNWFLSHRDFTNSTVIPSFHRPSVLNYILNENPDWQAADSFAYMNAMASIARATMRPLPLAANQFTPTQTPDVPPDPIDSTRYSLPINGEFTGGSSSFALRLPLLMRNPAPSATPTGPPRLNQLMEALINGPWDVDNDFDGIPDSIWVDLGLPIITAPDGKLLRPLVAPMIEDLSGRLNVNAHGNYAIINQATGVNETVADWANGGANQFAFRGLGYGPADINIPGTATELGNLLQTRYKVGSSADLVPGKSGADALNILMAGWRPAALTANGVYANSIDPFGRGAYGLSLSGAVVAANDGAVGTFSPTDIGETLGDDPATTFVEPTANESADNPYELDPTGHLSSDNIFTGSELEAIIRINEFDNELLPDRLSKLVRPMTEPNLLQSITATSSSDDSPLVATPGSASAYDALRGLLGGTLTNAQLNDLVAPELRLAHRLNINRRFGNGVDDNGNGVVDEPREYNVVGRDDDGNGTVDDATETTGVETQAFRSYAGATVDASFTAVAPNYVRDDSAKATPRQLLARHLYVLMMTISKDLLNQYPSYGDTLTTPVPVSDREAYRARRIAQWAVNVVDYRDPDAIMTRFAYDPNPSDGWAIAEDMNGNGTLEPATEIFGTSATAPTAFSPVVWGCEQPDLLFSESYATHDLRVRDTNLDTTKLKGSMAPNTDDDMDQVRIPQGSLFLELYSPRRRVNAGTTDPNTAGIPRELYDVVTGGTVNYSLDLERTITTYYDGTSWGTTGGTAAEVPVWRIAISEPHFEATVPANNPVGTGNSPLDLRSTLPDTQSFQPQLGQPNSLDELNTTPANLDLNRFVLFTNYAALADLQAATAPIPDMTQIAGVFFNQTALTASLFPEQYLSLAPRTKTNFGSVVYAATANPTAPSNQRFEIMNTAPSVGLMQYDAANNLLTPDTNNIIQEGLGLALSSFAPTDWANAATTAPNGIGLNVTEPLPVNPGDYYAEPTSRYTLVGGAQYPLTDAYVQLDASGVAVTGLPRDQPEDMRVDGPIKQLTQAFATAPTTVADPMMGSVANYRTAFLQRLADPTRGFHPTLNPYRTIDQIAIDLTVFSGEDTPANVMAAGNMPATPTTEQQYLEGSRQRTGVAVNGVGANVLYSYATQLPGKIPAMVAAGTNYFDLGTNVATTLNYLNAGFGSPQAVTTALRGRPMTPFAMHPWLNRPYATPHELMMVPACSQGRLLEEFSVIDPGNPDPAIFPETSTTTTDPGYAANFIAPFRHLLNFFNSENIRTAGAAKAAEFSTLFDFVGTGPRYRGETTVMLPSRITGTPLATLYAAPFNFNEDNRRFGKMNLNSIEAFAAWKGLMQGHMNPAEYSTATGSEQLSYLNFLQTRRGYVPPNTMPVPTVLLSDASTPVNYAPTRLDPRFPTQFAGVFRRSAEGEFSMQVRNLGTASPDETNLLRRRSVNAGLLRGEGTVDNQETGTGATTPTHTPFFVRKSTEAPLPTGNEYQNRNINPFLHYQTLMRMPNLASENSQVFLIRMTVGLFEVDANDTTNLGAEYGELSGQTQRFRAIFIVDRSIPVGFKPGQDLNARDTVMFERYYP